MSTHNQSIWGQNSTNVLTQAEYENDSQRLSGFTAGTKASSKHVNTALRHATMVASALLDVAGGDVLPTSYNDVVSALEAYFDGLGGSGGGGEVVTITSLSASTMPAYDVASAKTTLVVFEGNTYINMGTSTEAGNEYFHYRSLSDVGATSVTVSELNLVYTSSHTAMDAVGSTRTIGKTVFTLNGLTASNMPTLAVASNPNTVICYNDYYYVFAGEEKDSGAADYVRYVCIEPTSTGLIYQYLTLSYNITTGAALQVQQSSGTTKQTIDASLSTTSTNAVQNKVITNALNGKQGTLTAGSGIKIENNVISATGQTTPLFAESVDELNESGDTSKIYVLPDGYIYAFETTTVVQIVQENITSVSDNSWESGRLGSGGTVSAQAGYVTTPYIDLQKYGDTPFDLYLKGITFTVSPYNVWSQYQTDKTHIIRAENSAAGWVTYWKGATFTDLGDGLAKISFVKPITNKSDVTIGYVRFTGHGTESAANVYTERQAEVTTQAWVNTGVPYSAGEPTISATSFDLVNPSVASFMASANYSDTDYTYTQVTSYTATDYYRKDHPFCAAISWSGVTNATSYDVVLNISATVLSSSRQRYSTTGTRLQFKNLIPSTTYNYAVYAELADGTSQSVKTGSFTTTADKVRMLSIDGIQNVRDIGGYTGLNGAKVKYGKIFRGSAVDEGVFDDFHITDEGKKELLGRLAVKTDLDLRGLDNVTKSGFGAGIDFYAPQYSYLNYSNVITNETHRGYFKNMIEYINTQLTANKPVYVHCSGGCDRTGSFIFLVLGLLGVSESDIAKEYELSSFSAIGVGRTRNSTVYDYKGMVNALKQYTGATITDKFYDFATSGCGLSASAITTFRNHMLQS